MISDYLTIQAQLLAAISVEGVTSFDNTIEITPIDCVVIDVEEEVVEHIDTLSMPNGGTFGFYVIGAIKDHSGSIATTRAWARAQAATILAQLKSAESRLKYGNIEFVETVLKREKVVGIYTQLSVKE